MNVPVQIVLLRLTALAQMSLSCAEVNFTALNEWDEDSPLITGQIFELSGERKIATKIDLNYTFNNCLTTNRVMESGKHQMSLKLIKHNGNCLNHYFGLVRDGAARDKDHTDKESTDAWYMNDTGTLYGNGKYVDDDDAGHINEGQIVSMEADLDKGTLRFWVDGKPHGPGWSSGVTGRLCWAVCLYYKGAVEIVPTPELQQVGGRKERCGEMVTVG